MAALNGEDAMPRLAEKAGVRQNTISRYVNGLTRLRFSTALKLMELLRQEQGQNETLVQVAR